MGQVTEARKFLNTIYSTIDIIEENANLDLNGLRLRDLFKVELHSFFMYLSATDGKITSAERDFMNELFDSNISTNDYIKLINEQNIYSTEFEEKTPLVLGIIAGFDQKIAEAGLTDKKFLPIVMDFYNMVGKIFLACDGFEQNELDEFESYMEQLMINLNVNTNQDNVVSLLEKKKRSTTSEAIKVESTGTHYGPSIYKVGVDIPAGEYKLLCNPSERAYYATSSDPNGNDIIENDNFYGQVYVQLRYGQYFELLRAYAVSIEEAPNFNVQKYGKYIPGEYKVGEEIPAGEYKAFTTEGNGYYAVKHYGDNGEKEIDSNKNFSNAAYIEIRRGQILELVRCEINA